MTTVIERKGCTMRRGPALVLVVVLALAAAACASDAGAGGSDTGTSGTGAQTGGGGYGRGGYGSTGATGSTGSTGSTGNGAADLTVTAVNYRFDPSRITVSSGDVIEVRDTNPQTPHTFTVKGTDVDLALDPQGSGTVAIDLDPGTYQVVCRYHGATQGMTATLVVR